MKIIGFLIALAAWLGFVLLLIWLRGRKFRLVQVTESGTGTFEPAVSSMTSDSGITVVKRDGGITVSISKDLLKKRISFKMDQYNELSMQVSQGDPGENKDENVEDENVEALPNSSISEEDLLTPTEAVNANIEILEKLWREGKAEFKDDNAESNEQNDNDDSDFYKP